MSKRWSSGKRSDVLVTGLNEELDVGLHEGNGHGDGRSVRHDILLGRSQLLDAKDKTDQPKCNNAPAPTRSLAEDVVPSSAVQARRVVPDLVKELLHLERGRNGLDQDGTSDDTVREADVGSRPGEDVVPQSARKTVSLAAGDAPLCVGGGTYRTSR